MRGYGGTEPGQLSPTGQRDVPDIPCPMASCSALTWGEAGWGSLLRSCWALARGKWAIALCTTCLAYSHFLITIIAIISFYFCHIKLSLSQLVILLLYFLPQFSPPGRSEWLALCCLAACWVKPPHGSFQRRFSIYQNHQILQILGQLVGFHSYAYWVIQIQ